MARLLSKEQVLITLFITVIVSISAIPSFFYIFRTPPNTYYPMVSNYVPDYYQYISHMKDGADGKILMTFRSSPDNFQRKPVYLFYTLAGFFISKIGVDLFIGFFLIKIIFSFIKFMVIYYLLLKLFPKSSGLRILSFFFILLSTPFYKLQPLQIYYPTITSIDSLIRVLFIPHDLAASALLILAVVFFNHWLNVKGKIKDIFLSGIFFLLVIVANPAMFTVFGFYFGLAVFLYLLQKNSNYKKIFIGLLIIGVITTPVYFYYQLLFRTTLPFSLIFSNQKLINYNIRLKEFILISGPVFFLALFSIKKLFMKKDFLSTLLIVWAFMPLALFQIFGKIFPISHERIFETCFYIPFGILAAVSVYQLQKKYLKIIIIVLLVVFSIPYFYSSLKNQVNEFNGPYMNIYVPTSTVEAFNWLDKHSKDESVVVAGFFSGNLLMAFSHNKIMFGHESSAYRGKERLNETIKIYNINTPSEEIKDIFNRENVSYVLFAPDTVNYDQTNLSKIKNLKLVFSNAGNSVYYYKK